MYGYFWLFVCVVAVYLVVSLIFRFAFLNSFRGKKNDGVEPKEQEKP